MVAMSIRNLWQRLKRRLFPARLDTSPVVMCQSEYPSSWIDSGMLAAKLKPLLEHSDYDRLLAELRSYQAVPLDEEHLHRYDSHFELASAGRIRVATTDPQRLPTDDEVVVCYGSFPPTVGGLCFGSHIYRYVLDFWEHPLPVHRVEGASCWQLVDHVVYINLDSRPDRRHSLLRELARGGLPLDRVDRLPGVRVRDAAPAAIRGAIGCLAAHLKACRRLRELGVSHGLVLEDDFGFCDDVKRWQADLETFFARGYDYDVCLLATSKFGSVEPHDDLVCRSRQPATNTSAYLVSAAGLERLIPCYEKALAALKESLDADRYAADRCWSELQGGRFLLFNRKIGFQLASYSDIESTIACYLD